MSRVDEAMRRAAEEGSPAQNAPAIESSVSDYPDAEALSRESFPIEMPERRRPRPAQFPAPVTEATRPQPPAALEPKREALLQRIDSTLAQKVVVDQRIAPASREQYRRLAASLHHASVHGTKVVMIASAVPGEGKTLTASNLALTFSESYQRNVLLIDADLRKPALHTVFGLDNTSGLGDGLASAEERKLSVQQVSRRLGILPAGHPISDPMAGLTSDRMRRLLAEAREAFDWVIIDTPPVAVLPDANLLAAMVDAAILVVKAGSTSYELVQRALDALGRERTLGVVLNRAQFAPDTAEGYYGHYYMKQGASAQEA